MEIVMSCGNGIRSRGRTELDLSCRKPFDDHQRTSALGASPKIAGTGGGDLLLGMWCGTEQLKTKRWHVCGSRGSRSFECARHLRGADAAGSGARTHREKEAATSVRCCGRNRANER